MRRSQGLERPSPVGEVAAGDIKAELRVVGREVTTGNGLHADAGAAIARGNRRSSLVAGLVLRDEQMAGLRELERHLAFRQLRVDVGAGVQELNDFFLRAAEERSGIAARGLGRDHVLLEDGDADAAARQLPRQCAAGYPGPDDDGVVDARVWFPPHRRRLRHENGSS